MTRKTNTEPMLRGRAKHRRTQSDYVAALLDRVPLETWGEVVDAAVAKAKQGDAQARLWLAHYLVGRPASEAPTPLTVMVQQFSGHDPLALTLAKPAIDRARYPGLHIHDDRDAEIAVAVANELAQRIDAQ